MLLKATETDISDYVWLRKDFASFTYTTQMVMSHCTYKIFTHSEMFICKDI